MLLSLRKKGPTSLFKEVRVFKVRGRHLSVLNLKFDFISDGGCTREEQLAIYSRTAAESPRLFGFVFRGCAHHRK